MKVRFTNQSQTECHKFFEHNKNQKVVINKQILNKNLKIIFPHKIEKPHHLLLHFNNTYIKQITF